MATLDEILNRSAASHHRLCPRQVLGARMGLLAGEILGLELPQADKRLLTVVETDGCAVDGISAATHCSVGRRTLRIEDYGKVAATFVDTRTGRAVRIAPHPLARERADSAAPDAPSPWHAQLLGYQRLPASELLEVQEVTLREPVEKLVSAAGLRARCDQCGEEILNERELMVGGRTLCRACAGEPYYRKSEP